MFRIFVNEINPDEPVNMSSQKYSTFAFSEHVVKFASFRAGKRGVSRSSRTWCGMRWTPRCRVTRGIDANGEIVWSWRPDAGAKSWLRSKGAGWATVANEHWFTEESTYKP